MNFPGGKFIKTRQNLLTILSRRTVLAALLVVMSLLPISAEGQDLYDEHDGVWMSLERFDSKAERFPELQSVQQEKTEEPRETNSISTSAEKVKTEIGNTGKATVPTLEAPARPINIPVMPGTSRSYELQVISTEEEKNEDVFSPITEAPTRFINPPKMPGVYDRSLAETGQIEKESDSEGMTAVSEKTEIDKEEAEARALVQSISRMSLPIMPGVNQKYDLAVKLAEERAQREAEEAKAEEEAARAAAEEAAAKIAAEKAAADALAQAASRISLPVMPGLGQASLDENQASFEEENEDVEVGKHQPLNVRFANLPAARSALVSDQQPSNMITKKTQTASKQPAKQITTKTQNQEACAALTAYRKRQLDAIESDRRTLKALQAAISELGLDKKLDLPQSGVPNTIKSR